MEGCPASPQQASHSKIATHDQQTAGDELHLHCSNLALPTAGRAMRGPPPEKPKQNRHNCDDKGAHSVYRTGFATSHGKS